MTAMIKSNTPKPNPSFIFRLILFTSSLQQNSENLISPRSAVMARTSLPKSGGTHKGFIGFEVEGFSLTIDAEKPEFYQTRFKRR
jgi:hypothetical protein